MPLTVLYAEDHIVVADVVKETLEDEGIKVVTCTDGAVALRRICGAACYDLFIVDNRLPNMSGLEIVRHARRLSHRRRLPIIMLSACDARREAYAAGVDIFLRKPEGMGGLTACVNELIR